MKKLFRNGYVQYAVYCQTDVEHYFTIIPSEKALVLLRV
nr:MAG TPA: hypothetical protein [Caudoviricetes sp.]